MCVSRLCQKSSFSSNNAGLPSVSRRLNGLVELANYDQGANLTNFQVKFAIATQSQCVKNV